MGIIKKSSLLLLKRKEYGISQQEMAKKLNLSQTSYGRIEAGTQSPRDKSVLKKISKILNLEINEIETLNEDFKSKNNESYEELTLINKQISSTFPLHNFSLFTQDEYDFKKIYKKDIFKYNNYIVFQFSHKVFSFEEKSLLFTLKNQNLKPQDLIILETKEKYEKNIPFRFSNDLKQKKENLLYRKYQSFVFIGAEKLGMNFLNNANEKVFLHNEDICEIHRIMIVNQQF